MLRLGLPRLVSSFFVVAALAGCGGSDAPPPKDPAFGGLDDTAEYAVGAHVLVSRGGQWLPATVMQQTPDQRFVVRYDGYGAQWDEAVGTDRLKAAPSATPEFKVGERVLVNAQNLWRIADIEQQVAPLLFRVHYDGYGPEMSENLGPERMKKTFVGTSAHAAGESVVVDVNGQALPAKIMAVTAADKWIVRFDGYGAQYDQEVGVDRFRAPAPPAPPVVAPPPPPVPDLAVNPKDKGKPGAKDKAVVAPPATPAPPPNAPLAAGDEVFVAVKGVWYPAKITALGTAGSFKVKLDAGGEEEAAADRVARNNPNLKGSKYNVNQPVFVEWHGLFVPGKVLKDQGSGVYKVRYDGQGPENDDLVDKKRLHPR